MPTPHNERHALERERKELPDELTTYKRELGATPPPRPRSDASGLSGRSGGCRNGWLRSRDGWLEARGGPRGAKKYPTGRPLEGGPSPSGDCRAPRLAPGRRESTALGLRLPAALRDSVVPLLHF